MHQNRFYAVGCACLAWLVLATSGCKTSDNAEGESRQSIHAMEFAQLDSALDAAVASGDVPGGVVCIVKGGQLVHHRSFGWSNPVDSIPMDLDAIFRICSQTKALTATAAMILWERGLLDLDEPVSTYIPSIGRMGVLESVGTDTIHTVRPNTRTMTVRHLLTHQSGISYGEIGDPRFEALYEKHGVVDLFTTEPVTAASNCERISETALLHEPGTRWNYSLGLDVLVAVIEVVSGEPFDVFLYREVLKPLGMNDTHFYLPDSLHDRLVEVWEPDPATGWRVHTHPRYSTQYPVAGAQSYLSGGAGLCSTPLDYARFLQLYLNRGELEGHRLLEAATVDTIMANHELNPRNATWHQGLAFGVQDAEGEGVFPPGTFFWGGYFNTTYAAHPESQTIGILMKQTYGANEPTTAVFNAAVFGSLP